MRFTAILAVASAIAVTSAAPVEQPNKFSFDIYVPQRKMTSHSVPDQTQAPLHTESAVSTTTAAHSPSPTPQRLLLIPGLEFLYRPYEPPKSTQN
ncbi:hypothetical protein ED733_008869 [Metarhizium rileyi]|uniref:Uncharacterized protein n=1 Tax=Metarhizium rileyi (strain RCEF 4871) TaxID=1649241 RepID=A0A5C6GLZ1_METRR|nr:hypothetical protein ED733_008869 [Metarhizium rileyi]